jgi:hypothetical protein
MAQIVHDLCDFCRRQFDWTPSGEPGSVETVVCPRCNYANTRTVPALESTGEEQPPESGERLPLAESKPESGEPLRESIGEQQPDEEEPLTTQEELDEELGDEEEESEEHESAPSHERKPPDHKAKKKKSRR